MSRKKLKVEVVAVADSIERRELIVRFSRPLTDLEVLGVEAAIEKAIA